ncbi:MAG: endonuclease III [Paludibacteraceae bacterium]|nr:endonuclease III [Paludibacteraceae bacterium]MBQ5775217.1 endonuclease III [Paludibacteraceae bacterium]
MKIQTRYDQALTWFETNMPIAESELNFNNEYQLLVAVMLSAQCTDKRVNMVTPALFAAFPTIAQLADAKIEEVLSYIRSVSYPNSKATHLVSMAKRVMEVYGGEIPNTREELQTLAGVGRKTANVFLAVWWNQPTMAVDTHIFRVSERIGLTTNAKNPLDSEKQLVKHIPQDLIPKAHHWLLLHGRYTCLARNPKCHLCGITHICHFFNKKK